MALYINDKPYTIDAACEFLGIPAKTIPRARRKVFQLKTNVIDDRGTKRSAKSYGGKPEYNLYVEKLQREVKIRYAIKLDDLKDNVKKYTPKTLFLMPAEDGSVAVQDDTQFAYWFLNPKCLHSPFHNKDQEYNYEYQDKNADAQKEMDREEAVVNATSIIIGYNSWDDARLKVLAKGMGITGVDDMTAAVVKSHLKAKIHRDPVGFYNQAHSREVLFTGKIQEAIDSKVLVLSTINGMQRWFMKTSTTSEEILPIQYGQDAMVEIKNHMAEKWYLYSDKINEALQGVTLLSKLNNPENDNAFDVETTTNIPSKRIAPELTSQQVDLLAKMRSNAWQEEKIAKYSEYDLTDSKLHGGSRKAYEDNLPMIEAYRAERALLKGV